MPRLSPRRTVFFSGAVAATRAIRFAPQPMENCENMVLQFRPIVDFLQKIWGATIEFVFSEGRADQNKLAAWGEPVRYGAVAASDHDDETVRMQDVYRKS